MTMKYLVLEAPTLTDEAAVNIHDFFCALVSAFEEHYHYQMEQYYRESVFDYAIDTESKPVEEEPPF